MQSGGVVRMGGTWSVFPGAWRCPRGACGARVQRTSVVTTVLKCAEVKKLDRNACVAELSKLHVHLPVTPGGQTAPRRTLQAHTFENTLENTEYAAARA